jgi:hypothetical protein
LETYVELSQFAKLQPRWLRTHRAAEYSGMSKRALYKLFLEGKIAAAVIGWRNTKRPLRVYDRLSIDAYLEEQARAETT